MRHCMRFHRAACQSCTGARLMHPAVKSKYPTHYPTTETAPLCRLSTSHAAACCRSDTASSKMRPAACALHAHAAKRAIRLCALLAPSPARAKALLCSETKCCTPAMRCSAVPGGPRRGDAVPTKLNYKINHRQCLNVQRMKFTNYSPVVTPRTLPPAGRSTKWDTHHNSTPPHKGAAVLRRRIGPNGD